MGQACSEPRVKRLVPVAGTELGLGAVAEGEDDG